MLKFQSDIVWMAQNNTGWKQKKTQYIIENVLQQWQWIVFGVPSQHRMNNENHTQI